uniref:Neur_chan_LBD domain-containing protein n=1 Tax=Syphacia muris TaxID=451379 RepID=A0A0N5A9T0_9BILA
MHYCFFPSFYLEVAESNYAKIHTELQKAILKNYDKRKRPVIDQYSAVFVSTYVYLTHVSVDQLEQTVTLAGIIIMKWIDEFAVWDPNKYFGIKKLTLSQWEIWTPEIRATNSVNGRGQFYEISRRSHVTLESINATFNIKIACNFDYSSYPNDVQNCALGLFTIQRINEVHLIYAFEPSVLLIKLKLKRYAPYFKTAILLPAMISFTVVIVSYFLPSPVSAIYVLLGNFFLIDFFLEDLLALLPPVIGGLPAIEIANRTYQENQTDLHRIIFKNYNTDERPVRDPETTVVVQVHPHITHISIDQYGQTVTLNGIMHMKWRDEKATWEPNERNGVKVTNVKQWEIWYPKIMYSEVYIYPRFSLKIGCKFDYSTYPKDVQKCVLGIYTKYPLKQLNFTVADFKNEMRQAIGKVFDVRLLCFTRLHVIILKSILHTDIILKRYAPYYNSAIVLPATVSFFVIISSFFITNPKTAVYILIANLFLIGTLIGDLMFLLPPAIGSLPSVAQIFGFY